MYFTADLHTHSSFAERCSPQINLDNMFQWAQIKGIDVLSTGDFTHPGWLSELKTKLMPDGSGFFTLKDQPATTVFPGMKRSGSTVQFCLSVEVSCLYECNQSRKIIHHVLYASDFDTVDALNLRLAKYGNLSTDGRPTLQLSSRDLLEIVMSVSDRAHLVPAHVWTPWTSLFGSQNGHDSLQDCFRDLTPHIFALETGLSSDPAMNWQWSQLDHLTMLSSSDAHSLHRLGRELNRFDTELSYDAMFDAIKSGIGFKGTFECYPEYGKYSFDGHEKCKVCLSPSASKAVNMICPVCNTKLNIGAFHRVDKLGDRQIPKQPKRAADFDYIIPLEEILMELEAAKWKSDRVQYAYKNAINFAGNEMTLLHHMPVEDIAKYSRKLSDAIQKMRQGKVRRSAGYDGVYGSILTKDKPPKIEQISLF